MLPAMVVFFVVAGGVVAIFAGLTFLPEMLATRKLDRRLRDVAWSPSSAQLPVDESSVVRQEAEGPIPSVDRLIARTNVGTGLKRLIQQSGARATPGGILIVGLMAAAVCILIAVIASPQPLIRLGAGIVGLSAPFFWLRYRASSRMKRFEEQFPEALDLLSRAIRAGHAFQTAMGMVAAELPAPVGPEFKITFDQQNYGLPLRDALNELAERVTVLDVKFFSTAVLIQRDTGGNLSEILDNLAHVVRERFKIRRQVRVHTAHGRFTGYVLLALPAALAVGLSFINPDHMHALFHERMGQTMVMAAVVMQTVGFFWIRQVIKIEV